MPNGLALARGPEDGRALQHAIATQGARRAGRLDAAHIRALGARYRVFSALWLDAAAAALAEADQHHGATLRSPVDGLLLTSKGNIPRTGRPWTEGSRAHAGRIAPHTAEALLRLDAAGAVSIGATTLTELAMYAPDNPFEPVALNPWAPERTPGGSSAGAGVAAALGLAEINLGTDAGGSIRNPALHTGCVGFKPSLTRWSLEGVTRYAPDLDTLGVVCRSVADVMATDAVLADDAAQAYQGPKRPAPPRLRVPEHLLSLCDTPTRQLFEATLRRLGDAGCPIAPITFESWAAAEAAAGTLSLHQAARRVGPALRARLAPGLAARLARGDAIPESAAQAARATCTALAHALAAQLGGQDVVITPGWPFRAPRIYQTRVVVAGRRLPLDPTRNIFVRAANAARAPALVLPAGMYPGRVPFGVQLMAEEGADTRVLDAGRIVADMLAG